MALLYYSMKEIHEISEGSIVEVTDVAHSKAIDQSDENMSGNLELGRDEIIPWLQEGVQLEVRSIREAPGYGSKIIVKFSPTSDDIPSYKCVISSTYESWPNGVSGGCHFDADGYTTHYSDKYFDIQKV